MGHFSKSIILLIIFVLSIATVKSQNIIIDFEDTSSISDFVDFDGGTGTIINNPKSDDQNNSATVAQIIRDGGTIWSGSKIYLPENIDFSSYNLISMKVYTSAPIGTTIKFKLEGIGNTERDVTTTVSNAWETLTWDFTGEPTNFNSLVFMFDFGNVGDGSETSTFLFDDIEQVYGGSQIDLPVLFEDPNINHTVTDFGGNVSLLTADPEDPSNQVIMTTKTTTAATWAGTTIGTPAGFASDIPLSLSDSKMTVSVWSPAADTPIRLKVEDSSDPTHTCETETLTTVDGGWETITFDFLNQAPGTELLSIGLSMGWTYNMASIFFNFGTDGATAGEETYYFDDIRFGESVLATDYIGESQINIFPNPVWEEIIISGVNHIEAISIYNLTGKMIINQNGNYGKMDEFQEGSDTYVNVKALQNGIYILKITDRKGQIFLEKFMKI